MKKKEEFYYWELIVGDEKNLERIHLIYRTEEAAIEKFNFLKESFTKEYNLVVTNSDSSIFKWFEFYIGDSKFTGEFKKHLYLKRQNFVEDRNNNVIIW